MAPSIGDSYDSSIGLTYARPLHDAAVTKITKRTFWERVSEAMEDAGMKPTQKAAGALVGITQPSVSEWTVIDGYPSMPNAVTLAAKLGVCVEWLLLERGPKRPPPTDPLAQRLWGMWSQLDDGTKHELVGLASGRLRPAGDDREPGSDYARNP